MGVTFDQLKLHCLMPDDFTRQAGFSLRGSLRAERNFSLSFLSNHKTKKNSALHAKFRLVDKRLKCLRTLALKWVTNCVFFTSQAQFKLCYDAVTSVLRSFDEYSNFASEVQTYSNMQWSCEIASIYSHTFNILL